MGIFFEIHMEMNIKETENPGHLIYIQVINPIVRILSQVKTGGVDDIHTLIYPNI